MLGLIDPRRYDPAQLDRRPVSKVGLATHNALAFALSNPPQSNSRIPRIPSRRPTSRAAVSHDTKDSARSSPRSGVDKPLLPSPSTSTNPVPLGRDIVSSHRDFPTSPSSKPTRQEWPRFSPTTAPDHVGRASNPRVIASSPPPLLDPRHPQGNERLHLFADTSDSEDDDGDEYWRSQEYTSSVASSSDGGCTSSASDGDDDDDDDDDYSEPWVTKDYYFPTRPAKLKPPAPRKRIALFPVATKSHKRASFKEAHARRWGPLFPLDKDSIEEQRALCGTGRLAQAQFIDLVTPLVESTRVLLTKEARRKQRKEERKRKLALTESTPLVCSCSLKSTTTSSSPSSSSSSVPSDSTAATSCPACSFETKAAVSPLPAALLPPTPRRRSPVRPISKPVPLSLCPLTQHIVDLYSADQQAAARIEAGRVAEEEAAYQASLITASMRPVRHSGLAHHGKNGASTKVFERMLEFAGALLSAASLVHSAYRDVLLPLTPPPSPPSSIESLPTRGRSLNRRRLSRAGADTRTGVITRAYGYRVTHSQIEIAFPPVLNDDPSLSPEAIFGVPPSALQFVTFTGEESYAPSKSSQSRTSRSPSRLPRPWGNKTRGQEPSSPRNPNSNSDKCTPRGRSATKTRVQHFDPTRARPRLVADQRFLRVYALENVIRCRRGTGGDELDELGGCKSGYMGRGVVEVVELELGKSPLREEWVEEE